MTTNINTQIEKSDIISYGEHLLGVEAEVTSLLINWAIEISINKYGVELIPSVENVLVCFDSEDESGRFRSSEMIFKSVKTTFEMNFHERMEDDFTFEIKQVEIDFNENTLEIEL